MNVTTNMIPMTAIEIEPTLRREKSTTDGMMLMSMTMLTSCHNWDCVNDITSWYISGLKIYGQRTGMPFTPMRLVPVSIGA